MNIIAIVNPQSGRGKAADKWAKVRADLPGQVEALETTSPGHGIQLTRDAIKRGARTIVAVGGDGTINEVVNGFFEDDHIISNEARLGIVPYGTGSDFTRILNLPLNEKNLAAMLHHGESRMVDVMRVRYTKMDGASGIRYSINVTSFGMGGMVAAGRNRSYLLTTIQTAWKFPGKTVTLKVDGANAVQETITNVAVGNGQYHGGGMWVCPGASITDSVLDVSVIRYLSLFELLKAVPALYNGGILTHPKVKACRAKRIEADSKEFVPIEIDGEPLGRLPVEISVLPSAISVVMP